MKRIVSVSLGSERRDLRETLYLLGREVELQRRGTDGDVARARRLIRELDGRVDAIGLGGINRYIHLGSRRYALREAEMLAAQAKRTPVVDGGGLKFTLEKQVVEGLATAGLLKGKKVLVVSAVDRFSMAEGFAETRAESHTEVRYGDLLAILDLPITLSNLSTVVALASILLPVARHAPIRWLYPTGAAQERAGSGAFAGLCRRIYGWADVIAGDWHFVRRYLPARLDGKIILTNTTTAEDAELLRSRGASWLVTTTPRLNGRSVSTNVLEAAFVAVTGGKLLNPAELAGYVAESGLRGTFLELQTCAAPLDKSSLFV